MTIDQQTVSLTGDLKVKVTYHVAGDGPPVLLIHGWGTSWFLWQGIMRTLAAAGYRVYAPDNIGCGQSDKPRRLYTPHDYALYLDGLVAALHLERFILIGHSLGGHNCLSYALARPEHVERLIVIDPAFAPLRQLELLKAQALLALFAVPLLGELVLATTPRRLLRWIITQPWGGTYCPERVAPQALDSVASDIAVSATPLVTNTITYLVLFSLPGLSRLKPDADLAGKVGRITAPTLVAWGEHDDLLAPQSYPWLAAHIPGAKGYAIAAAGHTPSFESPQEIESAVLSFLGRPAPSSEPQITL